MKLVESDRHGPDATDDDVETSTPPRPEHRRVSVSLVLTVSVLVGTVVAVYGIFPERHNELLTRSLELHRDPPPFQLDAPQQTELAAWSIALFSRTNRTIPWPALTRSGDAWALGKTRSDMLTGDLGDPTAGDDKSAVILGASTDEILPCKEAATRCPAAVIRYRLPGDPSSGTDDASVEMTLIVQQARDAPPRTHRRTDGDLSAVSWRKSHWTFVAVGATAQIDLWRTFTEAP